MNSSNFLSSVGARAGRALRSIRGAFDLPSILVGIVVVGILTAGVFAAVFGVIPFAQDNAAKQDLAAVRTAEGVSKTKDGLYQAGDGLNASGYLPGSPNLAVGVDAAGSCWVGIIKSASGTGFYATAAQADPAPYDDGSVTGCITATEQSALAESVGLKYPGYAGAWGVNAYGQLGNDTTAQSSVPVATTATGALLGKSVTAVSATANHACAVADGAAYCWGFNGNGQLGDGTLTSTTVPVAVTATGALAGKTVTDISTGNFHTCAVADGAAYCWGNGGQGALGDGTLAQSKVPVAVTATGALAGETVTGISAGMRHSCAVAGNAAYCWGYNTNGQLGNGTLTDSTVPVSVTATGALSGKAVTAVSASNYYTCAVASGAAYCWGQNTNGQLGNGTTTNSTSPVAVTATGALSGKTVTAVSTGAAFTTGGYSCAVASGAAYCWGFNSSGQLGNNSSVQSAVPVAVTTAGVLSGKTVTGISAGDKHACAVASGSAFCWGDNSNGQLGSGNVAQSSVPVTVTTAGALSGKRVTAVELGRNFTTVIYK